MSGLKNRIKALEKLGRYLSHISEEDSQYEPFFDAIDRAQLQNAWKKKPVLKPLSLLHLNHVVMLSNRYSKSL